MNRRVSAKETRPVIFAALILITIISGIFYAVVSSAHGHKYIGTYCNPNEMCVYIDGIGNSCPGSDYSYALKQTVVLEEGSCRTQ